MKRQPLKRKNSTLKKGGPIRRKQVTHQQIAERKLQNERDWAFYREIWKERGPYSEVSGAYLGSEVNKACIHHIIPKSQWLEGRYMKPNCILLTIDEHATVENDMYRYEEINRRREQLIQYKIVEDKNNHIMWGRLPDKTNRK